MTLYMLTILLILRILTYFFFFFQAEDGIRDWSVTGVQTCALPISQSRSTPRDPQGFLQGATDSRAAENARRSQAIHHRSEERRVGKGVDLGGRRIIKKKKSKKNVKEMRYDQAEDRRDSNKIINVSS